MTHDDFVCIISCFTAKFRKGTLFCTSCYGKEISNDVSKAILYHSMKDAISDLYGSCLDESADHLRN